MDRQSYGSPMECLRSNKPQAAQEVSPGSCRFFRPAGRAQENSGGGSMTSVNPPKKGRFRKSTIRVWGLESKSNRNRKLLILCFIVFLCSFFTFILGLE